MSRTEGSNLAESEIVLGEPCSAVFVTLDIFPGDGMNRGFM